MKPFDESILNQTTSTKYDFNHICEKILEIFCCGLDQTSLFSAADGFEA